MIIDAVVLSELARGILGSNNGMLIKISASPWSPETLVEYSYETVFQPRLHTSEKSKNYVISWLNLHMSFTHLAHLLTTTLDIDESSLIHFPVPVFEGEDELGSASCAPVPSSSTS